VPRALLLILALALVLRLGVVGGTWEDQPWAAFAVTLIPWTARNLGALDALRGLHRLA